MMLEKKYNYFYNKIKSDPYIDENDFFRFYNLLKKHDLIILSKIYPPKKFDYYINIIKDEQINIVNKIEDKEFYLKKELVINQSFIQYFLDLSQTKNFMESEKNLGISRQAIKKCIENIEILFKFRFFEKRDFEYVLTKQGKELYPYIIKIFANIKNINSLNQKSFYDAEYNDNRLSFKSIAFYRNILKEELVLDFLKQNNLNQNFTINFNFSNISKIKQDIILGNTNFGIIHSIPEEEYFDFIHISDNPYVILGKPQMMRNYNELDYIVQSTVNDKDVKIMYDIIKENIKLRSSFFDLWIKLAEEGKYCFIAPEIFIRDKIKEGKLAIISELPVKKNIKICIIWNKHIPLNKVSIDFINLLKKIL